MKKYFKVCRGWGEDFISIEEKDLPRAISAQITGDILLANGTIAGNKIEMIVPDYHKTMGWNYEYKLTPEDHADVKRSVGNMQNIVGLVTDKARQLAESGNAHLIKNIDVEQLLIESAGSKQPEIKKISEGLADKFDVNKK